MKKRDIILAAALILMGLIGLLVMKSLMRQGKVVVVAVDGKEYGTYPLDEDREVMIEIPGGGYNKLVIKDKKAAVIEADCPDRLCVHQGEISRVPESVICLPHKLVVSIEGGREAEYDTITR